MPVKYVVIFNSQIKKLDGDYFSFASSLRELALNKYHCLDFTSLIENGQEISISYWNSLDDIENWKNDSEHKIAQEKGKNLWYKAYRIEIAEIIRENDFQP